MAQERKQGRLLVVDDNADVLTALGLFLKRHVALVDGEKNPAVLKSRLQASQYDLVLLDMNFKKKSGGEEGFYWLERIKEWDPHVMVIMITAHGDVEMAVKAMKQGATDFILKPWHNQKMLATISSALALGKSLKQVKQLQDVQEQLAGEMSASLDTFLGVSPAVEEIRNTIRKVAATNASVLILGENGTGKELVAGALHRLSLRAAKPFISIDMGALSDSLFESELFGHVKGAFTDARTDRVGRFELASSGTLFLDEIGNLGPRAQAKLLTTLQRREVIRVGANTPRAIDIRLICATNMPLYEMVEQGGFRRDLLYRINTLEIFIPPLRERCEDIEILANSFLDKAKRQYGKPNLVLAKSALAKLVDYHWPGNVRELQHVMERAVILCEQALIGPEDILLSRDIGTPSPVITTGTANLKDVEKEAIGRTLAKHSGNISGAARELGSTRATLYRKMAKYGL